MPRGGRRQGSGRKRRVPPGAKQWGILVTDQERATLKPIIRKLLADMRTPSE